MSVRPLSNGSAPRKRQDSLRAGVFPAAELRLVAPAPPPDVPALVVGDRCRLNSGSPCLTVVDVESGQLVVAWKTSAGETVEATLHRATVRRNPLTTS